MQIGLFMVPEVVIIAFGMMVVLWVLMKIFNREKEPYDISTDYQYDQFLKEQEEAEKNRKARNDK